MKLLVDMKPSPRWVTTQAQAGIESRHWTTIGKSNAPDSAIMKFARDNDCVVLTHDLDFSAILAANKRMKPSVVQIRTEDMSPDAIGKQVITALRQMAADLDSGALLTTDPLTRPCRLAQSTTGTE